MRVAFSVHRATVLALLGGLAAAASHAETLTYVLRPLRESGTLSVELTWKTEGRSRSALHIAPRFGTVTDTVALLKNVRFEQASGVHQDGGRWLFSHRKGASVICRYDVDAGRRELDWTGTHHPVVTPRFFHGIGNAFLLTPELGGGIPREFEVIVRWQLPQGWKAVSSLGAGPTVGARLSGRDVRESVYLAGSIVTRTLERDGLRVTLATLDRFAFTPEEFLERAARIIQAQCDFLGDRQFPPFLVTLAPVGPAEQQGPTRLAGMGLYHSFALLLSPRAALTDAVENLFAHELLHHWNGRLLSAGEPQELVYWWIEGITDYYALRILHESGCWSSATYARWVNRLVQAYSSNPAIHATNEQIRAGYWEARDTVGEVAYQRGHMLGLRWHRLARDHGVSDGLDALLHALLARARAGSFELTNETLREIGLQTLGDWWAEEFDRYVQRAETVEVPPSALAPALVGRQRVVHQYELGFDRTRSLAQGRVVDLKSGSPAHRAGLREGDELVGYSIPPDPDTRVELHVLRGGTTRRIAYYPRGPAREMIQFEPAR